MRRFVAAFFRHPFLLILPAILIPLIVVFIVRSFASSYQSQATIYVPKDPYLSVTTSNNPFATPAQSVASNMAQFVLNDRDFVLEVARHTDMPKTYPKGTAGVDDLIVSRIRAGLKITPSSANFILIQYSDDEPQIAAQVINALLQVYLTESLRIEQQTINDQINALNQQIQADLQQLNQDAQNRDQYISSHPNIDPNTDANYAAYDAAYRNDLVKLQSDQQRLQALNSRGNFANELIPYTIADAPRVPTAPVVKTKTTITAMIGGVALGLGVSLGLIGLLAVADRRIHSRDDLVEVMPVPVLEVVPRLRGLDQDNLIVGSEENLMQLAQVPVLATLPRFASSPSQESDQPFTSRAEDE